MEILGIGLLRKFIKKHPESQPPLKFWVESTQKAQWSTVPDMKVTFNSADYVPPFVVFDVGGNKYRISALVDFEAGIVQIDEVMTHAEYDTWTQKRRKGKR
jgi:mRNA interferase HigB